MRQQTGDTYTTDEFAAAMFLNDAKAGKTCWIVASLLGVFPGQTQGGVVDKPENLHVISFDRAALGGVVRFLKETCKAPAEALKFKVINLEDETRKISLGEEEYDASFYNQVALQVRQLGERVRGMSAVVPSSVTAMAEALLRGVAGPPVQYRKNGDIIKGSSMDPSKWQFFANQMTELRNIVHGTRAHIAWEGHLTYKPPKLNDQGPPEESLHIPGATGYNMPLNMSHVFRIRRLMGQKIPGTNCDQAFIDTKSPFSFANGGRNFNEALSAKEPDLTVAFRKLGLPVGHWGAKAGKPKGTPVVQAPTVAAKAS